MQKYGLNMLVTADEKLSDFFDNFLQQLSSTPAVLLLCCPHAFTMHGRLMLY